MAVLLRLFVLVVFLYSSLIFAENWDQILNDEVLDTSNWVNPGDMGLDFKKEAAKPPKKLLRKQETQQKVNSDVDTKSEEVNVPKHPPHIEADVQSNYFCQNYEPFYDS
jgi:hypothetical protein